MLRLCNPLLQLGNRSIKPSGITSRSRNQLCPLHLSQTSVCLGSVIHDIRNAVISLADGKHFPEPGRDGAMK